MRRMSRAMPAQAGMANTLRNAMCCGNASIASFITTPANISGKPISPPPSTATLPLPDRITPFAAFGEISPLIASFPGFLFPMEAGIPPTSYGMNSPANILASAWNLAMSTMCFVFHTAMMSYTEMKRSSRTAA